VFLNADVPDKNPQVIVSLYDAHSLFIFTIALDNGFRRQWNSGHMAWVNKRGT